MEEVKYFRVFGADGEDFALMIAVFTIISTAALLFLVPLLTGKLQLHEALVGAICSFT